MSSGTTLGLNFKKTATIKYKQCMKNDALAMGGNATDGCGEFLPDGEEGTIEALSCSACQCHRNFHRKEIEIAADINHHPSSEIYYCKDHEYNPRIGRKVLFVGQQYKVLLERNELEYQVGKLVSSRTLARVQLPTESDEQAGKAVAGTSQVVKRRFRTKFTQEQKEKLQDFAERVGWKMQKLEESVVQGFCQEVGVKRRVLRVWMHNNKHSFFKKNTNYQN